MLFSRKPLIISSVAILLVFSVLLVGMALQVYAKESERPRICDCFTYDGDFLYLKERLCAELKYVDRIVLLQNAHKTNSLLSEDQKKELSSYFENKVVMITASHPGKDTKPSDYLNGVLDFENRDIILISNSKAWVDYSSLYGSIDQISRTNKIYNLKGSQGNKDIQALSVKAFKNSPKTDKLKVMTDSISFLKSRRIFFQTTHYKTYSPRES